MNFQAKRKVDFSSNPFYESQFEFYDQSLLDEVRAGNKDVQEFFRLLALCHTVMPEEKDGKLLLWTFSEPLFCVSIVTFTSKPSNWRERVRGTLMLPTFVVDNQDSSKGKF